MKKAFLFAVIALFSAFTEVDAQHFSAAVQAGGSLWIPVSKRFGYISTNYGNDKLVTFDKGISLRYESKKRWAFEAAASHFSLNADKWETYHDGACGNVYAEEISHQTTDNYYGLMLSAQYRFDPCKKFAAMGLRNHVGFVLGMLRYVQDYEIQSRIVGTGQLEYQSGSKAVNLTVMGFCHTASYPVTARLRLQSTAQALLKGTAPLTNEPYFATNSLWLKLGLQAGVVYKL